MASASELPPTRGPIRIGADIARNTWFQVGGPAEYLFKPEDHDDLRDFLKGCPDHLPLTVIGVGSNLLVRDGGVEGVVIRLGRKFTEMKLVADDAIEVGAACLDVHVAEFAAQNGIAGLEFLSGIPGTIGGAVMMNAGAYGRDISQVLVKACVMDRPGGLRDWTPKELGFTYRHSDIPEACIVTGAVLKGTKGDPGEIRARIQRIQSEREATQPIRSRTGGSTFKNPDGYKAWELIDAAGCRGLQMGGAQVSDKHCNFLINTGAATAADLEGLGEEVRRRVKEKSGIVLEWEIKRIGRKA